MKILRCPWGVIGLIKKLHPHHSEPGINRFSGDNNGFASVDYQVTTEVQAPPALVGTMTYTQDTYPSASSVVNQMITAGVTIGDAVCTMNGFDHNGIEIASGIFVWAVSINRAPS